MFNKTLRFWRVAIVALVVCSCVNHPTTASERINVGGDRVSFIPPANFKALTKEQIAFKFPRANPPQYVFANDKQSVSVAITFSASKVAPEQLSEFKEVMEQIFPRMIPGLQWIARELVIIDGKQWMHLEMTSHAIDTDIHNHMYATSFDGKALIFGFNSTVKDYPQAKAALIESAQTIQLKD